MITIVKKFTVCMLFSLFLIFTYCINYPLFLSLRLVDIVLIIFAAWGIFNLGIKSRLVPILVGLFYIFYFLSTLYGTIFIGITNTKNFVFVYKYSVLFVCAWLVSSSKLEEKHIRLLLKILLFTFVVVLIHEFVSLWVFQTRHPALALTFRPNFPFTKPFPHKRSGYLGDAHLLAAYISTGALAILFCRQYGLFKIRLPFYCVLLIIVFSAMLLTGSRNGVVTFSVTIFLFGFWVFIKKLAAPKSCTIIKKDSIELVFVAFIVCALLIGLYTKWGAQNNLVNRLCHRTFYLNISKDQSSLGRISKFAHAYDLAHTSPLIIGPGLQSSPKSFFDGAIPSILISAGIGGLLVFATIIIASFLVLHMEANKNQRQSEFHILFFVSFNYILANLITEFFLVSRSAVPFAVFWGLIVKLIYTPKYTHGVGAIIRRNNLLVNNHSSFEGHVEY